MELLEALSRHCTLSEVFFGIHRSVYPEMKQFPSQRRPVKTRGNLLMPPVDFPTWRLSLMEVCGNPTKTPQDYPDVCSSCNH